MLLARMFAPRSDWHELGTEQELSGTTPTLHFLVAEDGTRINVWLVNVNGTWRAFDGTTPDSFNTHCRYAYQNVTGRFEDPCTGFKYSLSGEYIDESYYLHDLAVQDLGEYTVSVVNDKISVDLSQYHKGRSWRANSPPTLLP